MILHVRDCSGLPAIIMNQLILKDHHRRLGSLLQSIYGEDIAGAVLPRLLDLLATPATTQPPATCQPALFSQRDAILITYGDSVTREGEPPLRTLADFCSAHLRDAISGVHLLPFFPFTSDDGFSVSDYRSVNPPLGGWDDVAQLGRHFRLMFDFVCNHCSASHPWFTAFLRGDPAYQNFFTCIGSPEAPDVAANLALVTRPRALPLLTTFDTAHGPKHVWTTFSADQVDLNFANPGVLLEMISVLLDYARRGASMVRLDACGFMWKTPGTRCIHEPQVHAIIQLMRGCLEVAAPGVVLVTETNVPHADNISYFGDGTNEAGMVYNFALPPLVMHALHTGDCRALGQWAATLQAPSDQTTFFNFLASHDGVGLNPARGILNNAQIDALIARVQQAGGLVGYKSMPDGPAQAYELNVNFLDAVCPPAREDTVAQADPFIAATAIQLSLAGVPGIYFHSLFGSRGWVDGVRQLGHNRAINRRKLQRDEVERELADATSLRATVLAKISALLRVRAARAEFHPAAPQKIIDLGPRVFGVLRTSRENPGDHVLCLINVSGGHELVSPDFRALLGTRNAVHDLISNRRFNVHGPSILLQPYQVRWLTA